MWQQRKVSSCGEFRPVRIDAHCNISRSDSGRAIGWLGIGRGNDLRAIPVGLDLVEGVPYRILGTGVGEPSAIILGADGPMDAFPRRVDGIRVGSKASALHFLQGTAFEVGPGEKVGSYIVHYEDGATDTIPLVYGKSTFAWDDQAMGVTYGFAWKGRSQDGRSIGVCDMDWINKRPDVAITAIDFVAEPTQASPFVLAITAEI